jgi:glycosyltransferase involved in cell wall biosynthesis
MDISIIIPARNEQQYLNRTIENLYASAEGDIEVIVVLNGYEQDVDWRATTLKHKENAGERVAMNVAARMAKGRYLLRLDAHCDMSKGWDTKMAEVLQEHPRGIAVAVIGSLDKNWNKLPGWYAFCNLLPTMEEKWTSKKQYGLIEPNMAFTGCGFMIAKEFYWSFGGADESLPAMGAIGPEFALHGWLDGEGVYTRTDVLCGHIFGLSGYNTGDVTKARAMLKEKYGHRYAEILHHFPEGNITMDRSAENNTRTVTVERKDEHITTDNVTKKPIKKVVELFKYVYQDDGTGPSEEAIAKEFGPKAYKVGEEVYYPNETGEWVKVA